MNRRQKGFFFIAYILIFSFLCGCVPPGNDDGPGPGPGPGPDNGTDSQPADGGNTSVKRDTDFFPYYTADGRYDDMTNKLTSWFNNFIRNKIPFSFTMNRKSSDAYSDSWVKNVDEKTIDGDRYVTITYIDETNKLTFTLEAVFFCDYPALEYTVYVKNTGTENSPVIKDLRGFDTAFYLPGTEYTLNTTKGCHNTGYGDEKDFELVTKTLTEGDKESVYRNGGGRSTSGGWPYFDVLGDNCGLLFAIGWTGQWEAVFSKTDAGVNIRAGMQYISAYLEPGEEIRTPSYTLMYFDGDAEYGHNLFRRLVLSRYTPDDGSPDVCKLPVSVGWMGGGEQILKSIITRIRDNKYAFDNLWIDAGWYGSSTTTGIGESTCDRWAVDVGNWGMNKKIFPNGMASAADMAAKENIDFTVWAEPERAHITSQLYLDNPDMFYDFIRPNTDSALLNLGLDKGYDWMLGFLTDLIRDNHITVYRQDYNIEPFYCWQAHDAKNPDRTGITEIKYITNLYKLFDELLDRFPGLTIDNCASGGRRMDLEMMKRSAVYYRTDYQTGQYSEDEFKYPNCSLEALQYQIQSVSYWLPLSGGGVPNNTPIYTNYAMRSLQSAGLAFNVLPTTASTNAVRLLNETADLRKYFNGDYYQLIPPVLDNSSVQAYELYREDLGEGIIKIFSRPSSDKTEITLFLKGLDENTSYTLTDADGASETLTLKGSQLMNDGYTVTNLKPKTAKVIYINAE